MGRMVTPDKLHASSPAEPESKRRQSVPQEQQHDDLQVCTQNLTSREVCAVSTYLYHLPHRLRPWCPLQALRMVLPELADTLGRINRTLAKSLAEDPAAVALKLVTLRSLFPDGNILQMIEKR